MKFVSACFRRYRRIFEKFLHRDWDLVEILQKLSKTFFSEIFFEGEKMGQNCIFRHLSEDFSSFFHRCCANFESLGRDGGVFYPKVKRESKNSSIQPRTSRGKNAIFEGGLPYLKVVLLITQRDQHGFGPALKVNIGASVRSNVQILEWIRADWGAQRGLQPTGTVTQALRGGATLYLTL